MPCEGDFNLNSLQPWARVRDGSTLELSVETADETVVAGARVVMDRLDGSSEELIWEHGALHPGPQRLRLRAPLAYAIRVRVGFTGAATAEAVIAARIVKPDGSLHGLAYRFCTSGKRDDVGRATITIATRSA